MRFFFLLRTALKDRPMGPPTANHQPPPTANHQSPPTANGDQPPTANHCQPPPTAANHQSPTTNRRQPPPTATNHQLPTANRQLPPTANRQPPPTMVEHMECPRAFLGKLVPEHFFFSVKDRPGPNFQVPLLCIVLRYPPVFVCMRSMKIKSNRKAMHQKTAH